MICALRVSSSARGTALEVTRTLEVDQPESATLRGAGPAGRNATKHSEQSGLLMTCRLVVELRPTQRQCAARAGADRSSTGEDDSTAILAWLLPESGDEFEDVLRMRFVETSTNRA